MGEGIALGAGDRGRLAAIVADRNSPQKHVWRARIVLLAAEGHGTVTLMQRSGKSKNAVNRWRERSGRSASMGCCATKPGPRASRRWRWRCTSAPWP
jgi:Homeodomain-like domain